MIASNHKNKLFLLGVFLLGIGIGLFLNRIGTFRGKEHPHSVVQRLPANGTSLCSPLLGVETSEGDDPRLLSAKYSISRYIATCIKNKEAEHVSVYLMDLMTEDWVVIGKDETFALASLIKVPVMMIYLKLAEKDPAVLSKTIKCEKIADMLPQNIFAEDHIQSGQTYTVDELLHYMIVHSDNIAMALLMANINEKSINGLSSDLYLTTLVIRGKEHQISIKDIASLFRILYCCTYLNKDLSNKALTLLSQTSFRDGLVAGVPPNITVAHKFAERAYSPGNKKRLHDCGIVYYGKRPYLICVMTKGWDFDALKGIIKNISRIAYDHMTKTTVVY